METKDFFNPAIAERLSLQIEALINGDRDLTQGEMLMGCMIAIGSVVASIQCPGCRQAATKVIEKRLPDIVTQALAEPIQHDQHHVH